MKILVTGSSGHLGEALVRTLKKAHHDVIGIDLLASAFTDKTGSIANREFVRQSVTGGVWLEKGEWEALKSKGLHTSLHLICTAGYQRQIRTNEYSQTLTETFRDRIGPEDFARVTEFATWLSQHPKGRDICCYLMDTLEQKGEP